MNHPMKKLLTLTGVLLLLLALAAPAYAAAPEEGQNTAQDCQSIFNGMSSTCLTIRR